MSQLTLDSLNFSENFEVKLFLNQEQTEEFITFTIRESTYEEKYKLTAEAGALLKSYIDRIVAWDFADALTPGNLNKFFQSAYWFSNEFLNACLDKEDELRQERKKALIRLKKK